MNKYLLIFAIFTAATSLNAQESWSLQKCVDYALENNLDVRQAEYNVQNSETNVMQSKSQFLPSVNASAYYGYNFGQRIDPFTNQFAQSTVNTGNFNLNANWVLFAGLQNLNQLTQSQYDQKSSDYAYKNVQYLTSLAVTTSFLQILFNKETLEVANQQLETTSKQIERTKKLVEAGSAPKGSLYDIEAQYAREELAQVNADNQVILSYLSLKQLLRLPGDYSMEIVVPTELDSAALALPTSLEMVIQTAYDTYPSIKSNEYALLSAEKQVKITNSPMIPRLSLNGSVGTGYSGNAIDVLSTTITGSRPIGVVESTLEPVVTPTYTQETQTQGFSDQVSNNFNQSLGLSLSIPIFNKMNNRASVNRAKVNYSIQETALEKEKQKVRQDIEKAYADANAAFKSFKSTEKGLKSLNEAFNYAQKRFDVGMINAVDYNVAKTNLFRAESDLVKAKFDYIFRMKILDFYQGKSLSL
ncbi:MAG: TolC family protein [Salibacteraceae bacterium]